MSPEPTLAERIVSLLDHLGLAHAHFATQMPGDLAGLALRHAGRIAGLVLAVPVRLDPAAFAGVAARLLMIAGETGIGREATERAAQRLTGAKLQLLSGYDAPGWADVVADRTAEVVEAMTGFLGAVTDRGQVASIPRADAPRFGTHAGLTFRIEGRGPTLILLPFFLAPSQWDPAVAALARTFTVIRLGGAHIGGVATLEDRARTPTYRAMFATLADLLGAKPGDRILDVGCGSGALDRLLAERLGPKARITAVDLNPFLLGEAEQLARAAGLEGRIEFKRASAEALPFAEASFECAFSVTVLEECDAGRAMAELVRVVKPGGRVGVVVRAIDVPQWWSFAIPEALHKRATTPPQSIGKGGVADASLYPRMRAAGLGDLVPFPAMITLDNPGGPVWRYREDHILAQLDPAETAVWQAARAEAAASGALFQSHVLHAAVGVKG